VVCLLDPGDYVLASLRKGIDNGHIVSAVDFSIEPPSERLFEFYLSSSEASDQYAKEMFTQPIDSAFEAKRIKPQRSSSKGCGKQSFDFLTLTIYLKCFPCIAPIFRTLTPAQPKVISKTKVGTALRCQLKHKPKVQVLDMVSVWNVKDLLGLGLGLGLMAARGLLRGWRLGMGGSVLCDLLMLGWSRR